MRAFVTGMKKFHRTGSRVYGKPKPDSDLDLLAGPGVSISKLIASGFSTPQTGGMYLQEPVPDGVILSLRRGNINVIHCLTKKILESRLVAMKRCLCISPIERTEAVQIHEEVECEFEAAMNAEHLFVSSVVRLNNVMFT